MKLSQFSWQKGQVQVTLPTASLFLLGTWALPKLETTQISKNITWYIHKEILLGIEKELRMMPAISGQNKAKQKINMLN